MSLKILIIGQIPKDFSPDKHIPLGPFCFIGREDIFPNWEKLNFEQDPIESPEKLKEADQMTCAYTSKLILEIGDKFNRKLNINYSYKFWRIILFPWLLSVIQTTWERQLRIQNFIRNHGDKVYKVTLVKNNINWKFIDTMDFIKNGIRNILYNEWLFSRILEKCAPNGWIIEYVDKSDFKRFQNKNISNKKNSIKSIITKYINAKLNRCNHIYGMNYFDKFIINMLLNFKKADSKIANNRNSREYEKTFKGELPWIHDVRKIIWRIVPESIKKLNENSRIPKVKAGKINLGSQQLLFDDNYQKKMAFAVENGEKIIGIQHGGHSYGSAKMCGIIYETEYAQSSFITWGWKSQEDYKAKFIDLPSPLINKFFNKHKLRNQKIILVGICASLFSQRIDALPQANQWLKYRLNKIDFIKELNRNVYKNFYYRPFLNEIGLLKDKHFFLNKFPDIKFIDDNLHAEMLKCRLLILDHPGTTLNIALAANIPTICFWDPEFFPFCRQAEPYFRKLNDVGLLFKSGLEAAQKVNQVWDYLESWWNQPEIQKARRKWVWQYARSSKTWRWKWFKFLWKI